jgi:nicotinate-nucleotide adenylyltransferase
VTDGAVLGVFGGTFDPPHVGHRIVAADLVEALALDQLLVVPAARPPHRSATLDARTRLALVRRAFAGDPAIEVCDVEYERDGPSYTVDTLEWIRRERRPARLFLVVGADQYEGFDGWREPGRIVELAELVVMRRAGVGPVRGDGPPFRTVDVTRVDLSSTEVRRRLTAGESIRYRVPDAILADVERAWEGTKAERRMG